MAVPIYSNLDVKGGITVGKDRYMGTIPANGDVDANSPYFGINMQNSDLIGVNTIAFADYVNHASEGILFPCRGPSEENPTPTFGDGIKWHRLATDAGTITNIYEKPLPLTWGLYEYTRREVQHEVTNSNVYEVLAMATGGHTYDTINWPTYRNTVGGAIEGQYFNLHNIVNDALWKGDDGPKWGDIHGPGIQFYNNNTFCGMLQFNAYNHGITLYSCAMDGVSNWPNKIMPVTICMDYHSPTSTDNTSRGTYIRFYPTRRTDEWGNFVTNSYDQQIYDKITMRSYNPLEIMEGGTSCGIFQRGKFNGTATNADAVNGWSIQVKNASGVLIEEVGTLYFTCYD